MIRSFMLALCTVIFISCGEAPLDETADSERNKNIREILNDGGLKGSVGIFQGSYERDECNNKSIPTYCMVQLNVLQSSNRISVEILATGNGRSDQFQMNDYRVIGNSILHPSTLNYIGSIGKSGFEFADSTNEVRFLRHSDGTIYFDYRNKRNANAAMKIDFN